MAPPVGAALPVGVEMAPPVGVELVAEARRFSTKSRRMSNLGHGDPFPNIIILDIGTAFEIQL